MILKNIIKGILIQKWLKIIKELEKIEIRFFRQVCEDLPETPLKDSFKFCFYFYDHVL